MSGQPFTEVSVRLAPPAPRRPIKVHMVSRASLDMHEAFGLPLLAYCGASVTLNPPAGAGRGSVECWACAVDAIYWRDLSRENPSRHDHMDWHPEYDNDEQERDPS